MYRSSLLGDTNAFAYDPWSAIEQRSASGGTNVACAASDGHTMSIDQIRQQQQQIVAGCCYSSLFVAFISVLLID